MLLIQKVIKLRSHKKTIIYHFRFFCYINTTTATEASTMIILEELYLNL